MIDFDSKASYGLEDLIKIIEILRAPGGCPWDAEQTHDSIRRNFIEEACEAIEAIDKRDDEGLCEELGDVLMQVVFHCVLAGEGGRFDMDKVCDGACKKLINRHPHVFSDVTVSGTSEVLSNWDKIKMAEKGQRTHTQSMEAVTRTLPALWRAEKIQSKAAKAGFDWPDISGALDKLSEELSELKQAVSSGTADSSDASAELGDVLFSAVNVARFLSADPEDILNATSDKFIKQFDYVEKSAGESGLENISLEQMDKLWDKAKEFE